MQERRNSIANALELHLSCTNPSIYTNSQHADLTVIKDILNDDYDDKDCQYVLTDQTTLFTMAHTIMSPQKGKYISFRSDFLSHQINVWINFDVGWHAGN